MCADNSAGVLTRRSGFHQQEVLLVPVVVEDSGYPAQSSTSTLSVRVCPCGRSLPPSCSAHTVNLPVGLSAVMAGLLGAALLLGMLP